MSGMGIRKSESLAFSNNAIGHLQNANSAVDEGMGWKKIGISLTAAGVNALCSIAAAIREK